MNHIKMNNISNFEIQNKNSEIIKKSGLVTWYQKTIPARLIILTRMTLLRENLADNHESNEVI